MKSYNHLFEKLISIENILLAIFNSSRRKTKRKDVKRILDNPIEYAYKIQAILINGNFEAQIHKLKKKYDKSSKKYRYIIQPFYHKNDKGEEVFEHIIHYAVIQVLQPIFMKGMYEFSCGSVPNRGGTYGKKYLDKYILEHQNQDIKYCCKFDIYHYYLQVDINILKEKISKVIHDSKMVSIVFTILESNMAIYNGKLYNMGLPIGFYSSQWFANWFLQDFDHFVKEKLKIKCYVRYVDDVVLLGSNKRTMHKDFEKIRQYLGKMNLKIKKNYQVFKFDYGENKGRPIDFMGFKFYRNRTTLRKSIVHNAIKKARKMNKKEAITHYDSSQIMSYTGWFKHTKTYLFFKENISKLVNLKLCRTLISRNNKEKQKCN